MSKHSDVALLLRNSIQIPQRISLFSQANVNKGDYHTLFLWYGNIKNPSGTQFNEDFQNLLGWLQTLNDENFMLHVLGEDFGDYFSRGSTRSSEWTIYPMQKLYINREYYTNSRNHSLNRNTDKEHHP